MEATMQLQPLRIGGVLDGKAQDVRPEGRCPLVEKHKPADILGHAVRADNTTSAYTSAHRAVKSRARGRFSRRRARLVYIRLHGAKGLRKSSFFVGCMPSRGGYSR